MMDQSHAEISSWVEPWGVGDMKILDLFGIDLFQFFSVIGVVDTQVLVEDTTDDLVSESIAGLGHTTSEFQSIRKTSFNSGLPKLLKLKMVIICMFNGYLRRRCNHLAVGTLLKLVILRNATSSSDFS